MQPFATYVLRSYYEATQWNEDNLYSNLTRSSGALLDFAVPRGLHLAIANAPNALFRTTYAINALPALHGSLGYVFSSRPLPLVSSQDVRLRVFVDRFRVAAPPRTPPPAEETWLGGELVSDDQPRDYLLYGRLYVPSGRLDAVYTTRLSPRLQALVAAISDPRADAAARASRATPSASNVLFALQHDTGRTCAEYTYSAEDAMLGARVLHNFGRLGRAPARAPRAKRVDEEDAMEGGLKGRISAGAEVYFSAREKSAGMSTGLRFSTLPAADQPPTTATALFNPMLGHISAAYAARVSRALALGSRFDFNVYSYESEWTVGAEWWLRRAPGAEPDVPGIDAHALTPVPALDVAHAPPPAPVGGATTGVVKARASTAGALALVWEGRVRNLLVGVGVAADLSSRARPIRSLGLELSYFSSG